MKHPIRTLVAPLALVLAAPVATALQSAPAQVPRPARPVLAQRMAPVERAGIDETQRLVGAMRVLVANGYEAEAQRLREIIDEMRGAGKRDRSAVKAAKQFDLRAKRLLKADIAERKTRIAMLVLIADAYAVTGNAENEAAMRFFASTGQSQDGEGEMLPMPESLSAGDGALMDRLTAIVRAGEGAMAELNCKRGAQIAQVLGTYYSDREAPSEEPVTLTLNATPTQPSDLVTIERRVPILALAAAAYAAPDANPEARARMEWMSAMGRARVNPDAVEVPPAPAAYGGMDQLIADIDRAGDIHQGRGDARAAHDCKTLAEYYRLRASGKIEDASASPPTRQRLVREGGSNTPNTRELGRRRAPAIDADPAAPAEELNARRDELRRRVIELRAEVEQLRKELGGGR